MKIGLVALPDKIENYFSWVTDEKIEHFEIDIFTEKHQIDTFSKERIKHIKSLQPKGVTLSLHLPYKINPADDMKHIKIANIEYYKRCFDLASKLEAKWITTHLGYAIGVPSWDWLRGDGLKKLQEFMLIIREVSKTYGVTLAFENVTSQPFNSDFVSLGDRVSDFRELYANLGNYDFKLCLDVGHANISNNLDEYIFNFSENIVGLHIHDNDKSSDGHLIPSAGCVNWQMLINHLKEVDFKGPLNVELYDDNAKRKGLKILRELLNA